MLLDLLKALILGIVQGITEWLPISSTGHLILVENALSFQNVSNGFFDTFKVVIQFGSILAVILLYFKKLFPYKPIQDESGRNKKGAGHFFRAVFNDVYTWKLWGKIVIACLPAAVVGLLIEDAIDTVLATDYVIAAALIVFGIGFIWLEHISLKVKCDNVSALRPRTAVGIGLFQMLALVPGVSRSGSTILGASILGVGRSTAAEFSFFMAVPMMFGASAIKLLKNAGGFDGFEWALLALGTLVSFAVSVAVIKFLMGFIKKHSFAVFGWYRIVLGIIILAVNAFI